MSLAYIIDGYNLLRATHRWLNLPFRDQRDRLLVWIEEERPAGAACHSVTVVFDGRPSPVAARLSRTRVVFSHDREADDVIKDMVDAHRNPKNTVIVTDDRAVRRWVRGAGARLLGCEEFLRSGRQRSPKKGTEKPDSAEAESINAELRRLWKLK